MRDRVVILGQEKLLEALDEVFNYTYCAEIVLRQPAKEDRIYRRKPIEEG